MKRILTLALLTFFILPSFAGAQGFDTYTVKSGDSMWKIASKYQIGVSEIINANSTIKNPNLIYPMQKLQIPNISQTKGIEQQVVDLVNKERAKQGIAPCKLNWELSRVARTKSQDMVNKNYFSHQSPTYGSPFQMMKQFGIQFRTAGENIASGQQTPAAVMQSWMNSQGHRENIMNPSFDEIGVGYVKGGQYGHMWTQQFIGN